MGTYKLKKDLQEKLSSIDVKVDQGSASDEDLKTRSDLFICLGDLNRMDAQDLVQKAKIKWAIEGDENTKFFHGSLKEFFLSGSFPKGCNSSFIFLIPKVSSAKLVTDFRPISLIGCQYKIIGKILANRHCSVIGSCISPEQSAFIKGKNILGGPFILNEVKAWYYKRKKQLLVFKVDFEKAFDSLRWDFLDLVLEKIGFGLKWRSWIHGCLYIARSSVLVNGFETTEFELFRGLRQVDHLSLFLFILAMEGLHALTCKVEELGLFTGATFGRDNMSILHLIYADDVIFLGEWSSKNANNLICMLRCFFLIFGLKINVHKSNVLGVCVSDEEVSDMANVIGCGVTKLPFKYLGVPVGCNMARRHPRGGVESSQLESLQDAIGNVVLTDQYVDSNATRWIRCIPIKINVFLWRLSLNKLPSRVNLDLKGIDVDSLLCHIYKEDVESVNHIFFSCEMAKALWDLFAKWWKLDIPFCDNIFDWFSWLDSLKVSNKKMAATLKLKLRRRQPAHVVAGVVSMVTIFDDYSNGFDNGGWTFRLAKFHNDEFDPFVSFNCSFYHQIKNLNNLPLFDDDKTNNVLVRTFLKAEKVEIMDLPE
nr:RNA-directed DNA polymerase, eukaryota [Tanacetum cinerariifolium]